MPASFEGEALKAQAVAARTYILCRMSHPSGAHPGAAVCGEASCCLAYRDEQSLRELWGGSYSTYMEKIRNAVIETDGQYLTYEGEFIQAMFHSSSPGLTESSAALGLPVPYLVSVSSPETEKEVPNYITTVEVSAEDFRISILGISPDSALSGQPDAWLGEVKLDQSGRVESLMVGGKEITGSTIRGLFSLRSACFTLQYTGECFLFTVTGYGHGVGMSQYGGNVMAKQGSDYGKILAHYYPGTVLCPDG
jgi:stage II sporulation protein D